MPPIPSAVVVLCEPSGREVRVRPGTTLRDAVARAGLPLAQSCDGETVCGLCRVQVVAGADNLSAPDETEQRLLAERGAGPGERLACRARVSGPVTVSTGYW